MYSTNSYIYKLYSTNSYNSYIFYTNCIVPIHTTSRERAARATRAKPEHTSCLRNGIKITIRKMRLYKFIRVTYSQPLLTQPPHERTLTGRGSRVYPNVGAAGCTLKVGAAGCTLTSGGQPGAAWSGQEVCSGFALAAHAARSRCCMNS